MLFVCIFHSQWREGSSREYTMSVTFPQHSNSWRAKRWGRSLQLIIPLQCFKEYMTIKHKVTIQLCGILKSPCRYCSTLWHFFVLYVKIFVNLFIKMILIQAFGLCVGSVGINYMNLFSISDQTCKYQCVRHSRRQSLHCPWSDMDHHPLLPGKASMNAPTRLKHQVLSASYHY